MLRRFLRAPIAALLLLTALPLAQPAAAAELIVDNPDGVVQIKGKWSSTNTTSGFQGSDYLFRVAGDGSSSVFWPFPGAAGRDQGFSPWGAGPNRASNAPYEVVHDSGTLPVVKSQKDNGGTWQSL